MEPQSITTKLAQLSVEQQQCTIYRVNSQLRNVNDKAYEPVIISIGPYHRGKDNLKMLEEHKLHYLHLLLQNNENTIQDFISIIEREEPKARKCYAEPISLNAAEFTEMMFLDGIFIIELVRKYSMRQLREKNDPIFDMGWILNSLRRDLMLFESQIPFFILLKLFDLVEVQGQHNKLMDLFSYFFENGYPGEVTNRQRPKPKSPDMIKHLLDLVYYDWCPSSKANENTENVRKGWQFIHSAARLTEFNVKFESNKEFTSLFDAEFKNGTMLLAPITIEDTTESILRNLIAYEQYFQDTRSYFVTDYMILLDSLINSSRDVQILSRLGIIENWLGDDEVVANMFNKLGDSVICGDPFIYGGIFDSVNSHCKRKRNKWMAMLRRNYLNSPWAIVSIIVAVIIVILTITQTVCSILQVV